MLRSLNKSSSGRRVLGTPKVGVLGSNIPSSGLSGPAYTYNDLDLPSDADKYIRGVITTTPSVGNFFAYEDTSFTFSGAPDGVYYATYQLYVDNSVVGSPATITLTVGSGNTTINCTKGAVVATGLITSVLQQSVINTSVGTATAYGKDASLGGIVVCSTGNSVADGKTSAISATTVVSASKGNCTAIGMQSNIAVGNGNIKRGDRVSVSINFNTFSIKVR